LQGGNIGTTLVDRNTVRDTISPNRAFEEPSRGGIAALLQHKINDLPVSINSAVQMDPFSSNLDICLVHPPKSG
jgi:hypothetical protein